MSQSLKRFAKFCAVGGVNYLVAIVTFSIAWLLLHQYVVCNLLAYVASITNSFFLNRAWTFRDRRIEPPHRQAAKFVVVNVIGFALNVTLAAFVVAAVLSVHAQGAFGHRVRLVMTDLLSGTARNHYSLLLLNLAGVGVSGIMLGWNYLGSLLWSFRK
jgi:putative flippase GtrA